MEMEGKGGGKDVRGLSKIGTHTLVAAEIVGLLKVTAVMLTSVIIKSSTSVCPAKIRVGYWKKYHVGEKILGHRQTNGMS